jgi:hypothetical protein
MQQSNSEGKILDRLEDILQDQYDFLERNAKYHVRGLDGEFDLRAWRGNKFDYYEVKAALHPRSEQRAYRQFARARRAFGKQIQDCYIVTPKQIYGPV